MRIIQPSPAACKDCGNAPNIRMLSNETGILGFKVECDVCTIHTELDVSISAAVMLWNLYNTGTVEIRVATTN